MNSCEDELCHARRRFRDMACALSFGDTLEREPYTRRLHSLRAPIWSRLPQSQPKKDLLHHNPGCHKPTCIPTHPVGRGSHTALMGSSRDRHKEQLTRHDIYLMSEEGSCTSASSSESENMS